MGFTIALYNQELPFHTVKVVYIMQVASVFFITFKSQIAPMERDWMLNRIKDNEQQFDFIVIGGGATGAGIVLEAVSRGYSAVLFEKSDFVKSTSGKSTKLVHGGVRYLAQGDIPLVREACVERGLLLRNAPHLVKNLSFVIPVFGWFDELLYTLGLTVYDLIAGRYSLGRSKRISKKEVLRRLPVMNEEKLTAGILYHDGQFDDARLAINVLQTAAELGGLVVNYMPVEGLVKDVKGKLEGVKVRDVPTGKVYEVHGRVVVNATGVLPMRSCRWISLKWGVPFGRAREYTWCLTVPSSEGTMP